MYHCGVAITGMGIVRAAGAAGYVKYLSECGHSRADEYFSEHGHAVVTLARYWCRRASWWSGS